MPKNTTHIHDAFKARYKALNKEQKKAVDTTEGPVMVIAGPGTGKTEILTLRIANILKEGLSPANGILALTFTNAGVKAMRERLLQMVGSEASSVTISTFHSFGTSLISEFYEDLNLPEPPKLLDDSDKVVLFDELLENNPWQYLRGRSGGAHNFADLRSVISLLKQERMSSKDFLREIEKDIEKIKKDPKNYSSQGSTKGELKATEKEKLERFERTKEIAHFYSLYEKTKKDRSFADYDDILEYIVELVRRSESARATLRERFLYVLVDEHQDSSGIQNDFLEEVWGGVEKPNVFVVGDDRQLIYGFGGASLSHFERFKDVFKGTIIISLVQNHRSTQEILDVADTLLQSSLTNARLLSQKKENYKVGLVEAEFPRDEILAVGLQIKKKISEGVSPNDCAILLPKNSQVKSAAAVLKDLGLPVAEGGKVSFFSLALTQSLVRYLRVASSPFLPDRLANILLDENFKVPFLVSQKFLRNVGPKLTLESFATGDESIQRAGKMIETLAEKVLKEDIYNLVQIASQELFFKHVSTQAALTLEVEITRTMLHLALDNMEKNNKISLEDFIVFLERLQNYGQDIPLSVFGGEEGVQIRTLHASKGLEFDFVWIAHLDENSLMRGRQLLVTLPEVLKEKAAKKDAMTAKRELYVGITRAKRFCTLSFSKSGYSGGNQQLAKIIAELPEKMFNTQTSKQTEDAIRKDNELAYVESNPILPKEDTRGEVIQLVKEHWNDRPLSVTHLNNFFSCPWKWYFRNFLLLPEPETESLEFGNLMHASIEYLLSDGKSKKDIDHIMEEKLNSLRIYNESKRKRLISDGRKVLENFWDKYLSEFKGSYSEKKPSVYRDPEFSEIEVTGKIDVLQVLPDKTLAVTDFKTGRVKIAREIEKISEEGRMSDFMRQLSMYSYLLMHDKKAQNNSNTVSVSQLLFLEAKEGDKNALYRTKIKKEQIELLRKDIKDFVSLVTSGKWIDCPCDFTPFGRQKDCEYCAFAENLKLKSK